MAVTTERRTRGRIDLAELARLPSFYFPQLSYQRDRVAFYSERTGRIELYVMDLRTKETKQVSHGEVPRALRTGFEWDRAGKRIFFGRDEGGNEQHDLYVIDVWDEDWSKLRYVLLEGTADVLESGDERDHALELLAAKYAQYAHLPLGDAPVIRVTVERLVDWSGEG